MLKKILDKILGIKDIGYLAIVFVPTILVLIFIAYPAFQEYKEKRMREKLANPVLEQVVEPSRENNLMPASGK